MFACACALPSRAQSLEITKDFQLIPMSSVMVMYKNQFGKWEKPLLDDTFPYAVIRVILEGNEREVTEAKKKIGLYLGLQRMVLDKCLDFENEILFLIPAAAGHVQMQCGDGCERQTILDLPRLNSDQVYFGRVHYTPAEDNLMNIVQAPKRQYFKFFVTPADASIRVKVDNEWQWWPTEEGLASKSLNYGKYQYEISADKYHSQTGTITVSAQSQQLEVTLQPTFGWLDIPCEQALEGAYVYAINMATSSSVRLGQLPVVKKELDAGTYRIEIQKEKYSDYSTTVTITENETATLVPEMASNFAYVTLKVDNGAHIYLDNQLLAKGVWISTLEYGTYDFEARKDHHYSTYTKIEVKPSNEMQTFTLNPPIPMMGALAVEGTPAMASIYVDDKLVGKTPMIVSQLLAGEHKVRIEKEGYKDKTMDVVIEENKEQLMEYELTKNATASAAKPTAKPTPKLAVKPTTKPTAKPAIDLRKTLPVPMQESIAKATKDNSNTSVKPKRKTFVLANAATPFKSQLWGVGLVFGQMYNGYGWYVKGRSNFQGLKTLSGVQCGEDFTLSATDESTYLDYNQDGVNDIGITPFLSGNTKASAWLVSVGCSMDFLTKKVLRNKNSAMGLYVGLGYGVSRYGLQTADGNWIEYAPWSAMGVSADVGLIGSIGGFTMAAGLTTINFKTVEAELSIGWMF